MLFSLAETSFSAAQNRSKRTGGITASNAINAATAANVLMVASAFKMTSFGQPIAQENKQLHSSPRSTDAAADHLPPSAQGAVAADAHPEGQRQGSVSRRAAGVVWAA